jgi:hypothetical protein
MKKSKYLLKLPNVIKVRVFRTKESNYVAELVDYDVFTQAKTSEELQFMVNDLIYEYFDLPKNIQNHVWYKPKQEKPITRTEEYLPYQILASKQFRPHLCA